MQDELDIYALLTASEAAEYAGVHVEAILNWRNHGRLTVSGTKNGRPAYRLLDVAKAEHATRKRARR